MHLAPRLARVRKKGWFAPLARLPALAFRLGLRPLVGRWLLLLTTRGRRSGLPRHTMLLFRRMGGRKYSVAGYGTRSDWYLNLRKDPHVTVTSVDGNEACRARCITEPEEVGRVARELVPPSVLRALRVAEAEKQGRSRVGDHENLALVVFEPTDRSGPPPPRADLLWIWPVSASIALSALRKERGRASGARSWRGGRRGGWCREG